MGARQRNVPKVLPKSSGKRKGSTPSTIEVVDCGVDWITVTARDPLKRAQMEVVGVSHLDIQAAAGEKVTPWKFEGYEGLNCDQASFGTRPEDCILRLSGPTAYSHWRRAYELSDSCSRIDLQVTVRIEDSVPTMIRRHFKEATRHYRDWLRKPEVDMWRSNKGSDTLYLNKRVSEQFGRVYDKGFESKLDHYRQTIRYEVEYKGRTAKLVALKMSQVTDVGARAASLCLGFFRQHGLCPPAIVTSEHRIAVPRSRSTALKRLTWLAKAVRPSVDYLVGLGKLEETLEALGLTDRVTIAIEDGD